MAEIAEKIRPPAAISQEEFVDHGIVETRHGSRVQAQCTRGQNQIGALQGAVAECGAGGEGVVVGEPRHRVRIVREQLRQLFEEFRDDTRLLRSPAPPASSPDCRPTAPEASFSFAYLVRRKRNRAGDELAEVGPCFSSACSARNSSSVTGWSVNLLWVRAWRNSRSSA